MPSHWTNNKHKQVRTKYPARRAEPGWMVALGFMVGMDDGMMGDCWNSPVLQFLGFAAKLVV